MEVCIKVYTEMHQDTCGCLDMPTGMPLGTPTDVPTDVVTAIAAAGAILPAMNVDGTITDFLTPLPNLLKTVRFVNIAKVCSCV